MFRSCLLLSIFLIGISSLTGRPITITEINFDRREFIEFYNHSETPIDLTGYTVIGGIDAFLFGTLQPKEYAVIVSSIPDFRRDYGNTPRILAEYERILDNDGEEIALRDPTGAIVFRIHYRIPERGSLTAPDNWPPDLFLKEHPLEFTFPDNLDLSQSDGPNWRRAYRKGGTPGRGTVEQTIAVNILDDLPPLRTYSQWAFENLPNQNPETNQQADPDYDGIPNLLEFLTGSNPLSHDENPLSVKSVYYQPDQFPWRTDRFAWFEFSFLRHRNPANAGLRFEESPDLLNWTTLPTHFDPTNPHQPAIEVIDRQREKLTYRIQKDRTPKFLRLRALTAR